MTAKTCRDCQSPHLVPRGTKGFRNQCHKCWAATQRARWASNREACIIQSRANYKKHAKKRRQESIAWKASNREYYSLLEWFRKNKISIREIPPEEVKALVEMKKAIKAAKSEHSMKTATALILESSDFTKDHNLKKEAFEAFSKADLVVHEGRVIKTGATMLPQTPQEPVKRARRTRAAEPAQTPTRPNPGQQGDTSPEPSDHNG